MSGFIITVFILITTTVIGGCDIERADKQAIEKTKKEKKIELKVKEEVKTPSIVSQRIRKIKPKQIKLIPESVPELLNSASVELVLDLSVPVKFIQEISLDKTTRYQQQNYLPDLFAKKNKQKERNIEVDGKLIENKEEEVEKQRRMDGIGIAIKLTR